MEGTAHSHSHGTQPHTTAGSFGDTLALLGAGQGQTVPCQCLVPYALVTMSVQDKIRGASGGTLLWGKGMARLWRHQGLKGCQGLGHTPGLCLWRKSEPGVNWGANRSSFSSFPPAPQCTLG